MAKRLITTCVVLGVILSLTILMASCGKSELDKISEQINIDVTNGEISESSDSHGGFLGDGLYFESISFDDDTILERISANPQWKALPLDRTTEILVYGINNKDTGAGPYITQDNEAIFPLVENGYYLLIDRQENQTTDMLDRESLNITVALYDADTNILYYCELDT